MCWPLCTSCLAQPMMPLPAHSMKSCCSLMVVSASLYQALHKGNHGLAPDQYLMKKRHGTRCYFFLNLFEKWWYGEITTAIMTKNYFVILFIYLFAFLEHNYINQRFCHKVIIFFKKYQADI